MFQEKSDICVDDGRLHLVKDKDFGQWPEEAETETGLDSRFRSTGDEEFDVWNLFNQSTHDREDGRLRFFIRALVQCINDNDRRDV